MNQGLIINVDGTTRVFEVLPGTEDTDPNYDTLKNAVGGWIELVRLADDLVMYCNEEGKLMRLDVNYPIMNFLIAVYPNVPLTDVIVGNVVLVGDDGSPNSAGLSDRWVSVLRELGLWPSG